MKDNPAEMSMRRYEVAYRGIGYAGVIQHQNPAMPKYGPISFGLAMTKASMHTSSNRRAHDARRTM